MSDKNILEMWQAEAEFGFMHVAPYCSSLTAKANVLEVGSGSGILLAKLQKKFPNKFFQGLEPFSSGFSSLHELEKNYNNLGLKVHRVNYENFKTSEKFDLIFCINVFEHLNDWRDFLSWSAKKLKKNGILLVLCPNYDFPYESHFHLPIVFNKFITSFLFKAKIEKFEQFHDVKGLWRSLNFVRKSEVKNFLKLNCSELKFELSDKTEILRQMIDRLFDDVEFRNRHIIMGNLSVFLKKTKLLEVFFLFPRFLPYMKLEFQKLD